MKSVGIMGLPRSGKTTLFEILMQGAGHVGHGEQVGMVRVPDERVERLSAIYKPKKAVHAQLRFVEPAASLDPAHHAAAKKADLFAGVRNCDALLVVVRAFPMGDRPPDPAGDWGEVEAELAFNDLVIVEGRRERIEKELRVGKKELEREHQLLARCQGVLEAGHALRAEPLAPEELKMLRGFQLLTLKPCLIVWNRGEEAPVGLPELGRGVLGVTLPALIEREIVSLPAEDRPGFRAELGLAEDGLSLIIRKCYELLGVITFFTVAHEEVHAWTLERGAPAVEAAGEIHTDMAHGFIRADVVPFDRLVEAGSHAHAREHGWARLEGRDYRVQDGDIIEIRFSR